MTDSLTDSFADHIPWLNQCNIDNRPKLNMGDLRGPEGNMNNILMSYNEAMSSQGFRDEARYWGREIYHFNMLRLRDLNMNYNQVMGFILSMTNSSLEIMMNAERGILSAPFVENKNAYNSNGENCYGRTPIFYAVSEPKTQTRSIQDIIYDEGFEILLEKDKLGMTPFDHWLLSGKVRAYVKGMMNLVINATEEEIKEVMNNKPFGYSSHDNIASHVKKVGISGAFYYALLKSTDQNKNEYIDKYVGDVLKNLEALETSDKKKLPQAFKDVLGNIEDFKYLAKENDKFKYIILRTENQLEIKMMERYGAKYPEFKALMERKQLMKAMEVSPEVQEIRKSRRL